MLEKFLEETEKKVFFSADFFARMFPVDRNIGHMEITNGIFLMTDALWLHFIIS